MKIFIWVTILAINLTVRLVGLDRSPASLNWDEASLGYNAYSLGLNGKDEYGTKLPISLRSFDDYKPALYSYLSVIPVKIWGLNQFSVRFVSALAGTLALIPLAWLFLKFIKNEWLVMGAVLVMGLGPLRVHFSRVALETNLSASLFSLGMMGWWQLASCYRKRIWSGTLAMAGAVLAYHSARVAAPAVGLLLALDPIDWIKIKKISLRWKALGATFGVITLVVLLALAGGGGEKATARLGSETIGRFYPYVSLEVFEGKLTDWIFNNPVYYLGGRMVGHGLSFISPANFGPTLYHWIRNSVQYVPTNHWLGWLETMALIPGIWLVINKLKFSKYRKLIYWYLAGVAPSMITWNWFHSLRGLNVLPVLEVTALLGGVAVFKNINRTTVAGVILTIFIVFQLVYGLNNVLVYAVTENNKDYQPGGFKDGAGKLMELASRADRVIVDSPQAQAYIFVLFYGKYNPLDIQKYGQERQLVSSSGSKDFNFDKFEFRKVDWGVDEKLKNTVIWTTEGIGEEQVKAVGGRRWLVAGPTKEYNAAQIIYLPN